MQTEQALAPRLNEDDVNGVDASSLAPTQSFKLLSTRLRGSACRIVVNAYGVVSVKIQCFLVVHVFQDFFCYGLSEIGSIWHMSSVRGGT